MTKILVVLVVVTAILVGGGLVLRFVPPMQALLSPQQALNSDESSLTSKVFQLEEEIATLKKTVENLSSASAKPAESASAGNSSQIAALDSKISNLQIQINQLKTGTVTTTTTKKPPVYIPLGSNATTTDSNWTTLAGFQISINPEEYNGYSGMVLEVTSRLNGATSEGKARLYNVTDGSVVALSEISTKSTAFSLISSSTFKLSSGVKTYALQVQSVNSDIYFIQDAKIKVSY